MKEIKPCFLRRVWLAVTQKNMNESLATSSAMKHKIVPGDCVIHTVSGARGVVYAMEKINGAELLSFHDGRSGLSVRRVARQECRLANSERYAQ